MNIGLPGREVLFNGVLARYGAFGVLADHVDGDEGTGGSRPMLRQETLLRFSDAVDTYLILDVGNSDQARMIERKAGLVDLLRRFPLPATGNQVTSCVCETRGVAASEPTNAPRLNVECVVALFKPGVSHW